MNHTLGIGLSIVVISLISLIIYSGIISYYYIKNIIKIKNYTNFHNPEHIKFIKEVLSLIDLEIHNEVIYTLKDVIYLNKMYDPLQLDNDITTISNRIFNDFNKEIFSVDNDPLSVVSTDFWMHYIVKQTTDTILIVYRESQQNGVSPD